MEECISQLESEVADLKGKRRDGWDIAYIAGNLLLPVAVAFAGYFYSLSMKHAEITAAERHAHADEEVAHINSRIGQADLVLKYFGELFGSDAKRRDMAAKTIQKAIPDFGSLILAFIAQSPGEAGDAPTKQVVLDALGQRRASIVEALFAPSASQRNNAYEQLISQEAPWRKDPALIDDLINAARRHMDDPTGLRNVTVTLRDVSRTITQPRRPEIVALADDILKANPNVKSSIDLKAQIENMKNWIPKNP